MPPKPWENGKYKPAPTSKSGSFVANKAVNAPLQRTVATAVFVLLQSAKLVSAKTYGKFVVFSALDVGFIGILLQLRIPRLNFKRSVAFFQIFLLIMANYTLFISAGWLLPLLGVLTRPLLWLMERTSSDLSKKPQYIQGKYVVDILPEASAFLDTIKPLCIPAKQTEPVYLRLSVENTWPSMVSMSRAELGNTSDYENLLYNRRQVAGLPSEAGRLYVPVTKPGAYYLNAITDDETGLRVKIERTRVVIPPCPRVQIRNLGDALVCPQQQLSAEVVAEGVGPFKLQIDGQWVTIGEPEAEDAVQRVAHRIDKPVSRSQTVDIVIGAIYDGLGACDDSFELSKVSARVLPPTVARFGRERSLAKVADQVDAVVEVIGAVENQPFQLKLQNPQGNTQLYELSRPGAHKLPLKSVGEYKLVSLQGAKCEGQVEGVVSVFEPPRIAVENEFSVIQDKCAGPTGVLAHLKLMGSAPFVVSYRTWRHNRVVHQSTVTFPSNSGTVTFQPRDVGEFAYEITQVADRYRQLSFTDLKTTQIIKELPGARFGAISSLKLCGSDQVQVPIEIQGRGPFTLHYQVDDKHRHQVTTTDNSDRATVLLDLKLSAGSHFVRLTSLTDRNGCVTDLGGVRSPNIAVYPKIAHIALKSPGQYRTSEPVRTEFALLAADLMYPATLVYEHTSLNRSVKHQVVLNSSNDQVPVSEPGLYQLVSLNDNVCGGTVEPNQTVVISLYERPQIKFLDADNLTNICWQAKSAAWTLGLEGEPPFTLIHEVLNPEGKSNVKTLKINNNSTRIPLDTKNVGQYEHYFWLLDRRYPDFDRRRFITKQHSIPDPAEASFASAKPSVRVCENSYVPPQLPLVLKGAVPLTVDVQVGSAPVKQHVITDLSQKKLKISEDLKVGVNKVKLLGVSDRRGCRNPVPPVHAEAMIEVLAGPMPPKLAKTDICLGDAVSVGLGGRGTQFRVQYQWNNRAHTEAVSGREFTKLVKTPGNFTIVSVANEHGCRVNANSTVEIHPLPKSTITESPHFSIYEGDQISLGFAFEGTAPFSFKFTRSVNGKVEETHTITDIMEKEYTLIVDQGGEYEIIELHDKFCTSYR